MIAARTCLATDAPATRPIETAGRTIDRSHSQGFSSNGV